MSEKVCRVCGVQLVVGENWSAYDGKNHHNICVPCKRQYMKEYRKKNKSRFQQYKRKYAIQNNINNKLNIQKNKAIIIKQIENNVILPEWGDKYCIKCGNKLILGNNWEIYNAAAHYNICKPCRYHINTKNRRRSRRVTTTKKIEQYIDYRKERRALKQLLTITT